jgi:hypothetical protein
LFGLRHFAARPWARDIISYRLHARKQQDDRNPPSYRSTVSQLLRCGTLSPALNWPETSCQFSSKQPELREILLMATNPRSEDRNTATAQEGARESARRGAEQAERIARASVDVNSQAARTSTDIMERNVKTAQQVMQSGAEMAARLAERSAQQFNRAFGLTGEEAQRTAEFSTGNFSTLLRSSAMLAELTQEMALEWMQFGRDRLEQNFDRFDHLLHSRTPQDVLALQGEIVRSNLEGFLGMTRRAAEKSMHITEELAQKFGERAEQSRRAA